MPNTTFYTRGSAFIGGRATIDGRDSGATEIITTDADRTLTADESGATVIVSAADVVITLPATAAGLTYTIVLAAGGLSAGTGLSVSPQAADKIMGNGFTSADDKDAILAGSGDREGDSITLCGDGAAGWYITNVVGTWTREA